MRSKYLLKLLMRAENPVRQRAGFSLRMLSKKVSRSRLLPDFRQRTFRSSKKPPSVALAAQIRFSIHHILKSEQAATWQRAALGKFEPMINLTTAKALGLIISESFCCAPTRRSGIE